MKQNSAPAAHITHDTALWTTTADFAGYTLFDMVMGDSSINDWPDDRDAILDDLDGMVRYWLAEKWVFTDRESCEAAYDDASADQVPVPQQTPTRFTIEELADLLMEEKAAQ